MSSCDQNRSSSEGPQNRETAKVDPFHENWEQEARSVLAGFLQAGNPEDMLPLIIPIPDAEELLATHSNSPEILDESLFTPAALSEEVMKEGLYGLIYERPGFTGYDYMFRPLVAREVELGVSKVGLWDAFARNKASENIRTRGRITAFFRRDGDRLLLDASTFYQSRDETLRHFASTYQVGQKEVRILISPPHPRVEDLFQKNQTGEGRWFWIEDPSYENLRYPLFVSSSVGSELLSQEWKGPYVKEAATIVIEWSADQGHLVLSEWLCWNFHGLPGELRTK